MKLEDRIPLLEITTQKRRTIWNSWSPGTCHLLSKTTEPMANPPCLSCFSTIILLWNQCSWSELSTATTWPYQRRRRVWSGDDCCIQKWGKGYLYLVKWTGYSSSENTWQNADSLKGASEILKEYKTQLHLWILFHIILRSSYLIRLSHLLTPKSSSTNNNNMLDLFTFYETNLSNKCYSIVSPIPLTKTS